MANLFYSLRRIQPLSTSIHRWIFDILIGINSQMEYQDLIMARHCLHPRWNISTTICGRPRSFSSSLSALTFQEGIRTSTHQAILDNHLPITKSSSPSLGVLNTIITSITPRREYQDLGTISLQQQGPLSASEGWNNHGQGHQKRGFIFQREEEGKKRTGTLPTSRSQN